MCRGAEPLCRESEGVPQIQISSPSCQEVSLKHGRERFFRILLVWYEILGTTQEAIAREKALKKWNREWKIRLIESHNPTWADLYNQLI